VDLNQRVNQPNLPEGQHRVVILGYMSQTDRAPATPLDRLEEAKTIDDVVRNLEQIIDWSIRQRSTIGYFATLYKRATIAVRDALAEREFEVCDRMEHFDVVFANRYFNALNAYFYPGDYDGLTLAWEVAFVGHENPQTSMLQQMVAALNAHINFDLGITAVEIAATSLRTLENDFNLINALVATQIRGMLDVAEHLSPRLRLIRKLIPNEVGLIKRLLKKFRKAAWHFAIFMAMNPDKEREKRVNQVSWTAALGAWYLNPPGITPVPRIIRSIAKRESRDVAANIQALDGLTNRPEKKVEAYL
jgi:hypothetical protein